MEKPSSEEHRKGAHMFDQEKEQPSTGESAKEQAQYTPSMQPEFMREKIKQRPVNKMKLLRQTLTTALMAVVFGLVACFTFLVLEPVISNRLYPEEEPKKVEFPEETAKEEMKPEDMLVKEEAPPTVDLEQVDEQIEERLAEIQFSLEDYQALHDELRKLTETVSRSLVTVAGLTADVDWFNNPYENVASASGVIFENNEKALLILVSAAGLNEADSIEVTFCDQSQAAAELIQKDENTGLAVLSVPLSEIKPATLDAIDIATFGSSLGLNLAGTPVIALGSPTGVAGSVCYGMVTSAGAVVDMPDAVCRKFSTDIYAGQNATGVLVNLNGMVIGVIDNPGAEKDRERLLGAYGISELKGLIAQMSNDKERAYLGVHGADVPKEVAEDAEIDIPAGAYIREIEIDSPAMAAGIQSGDVITKVGEVELTGYGELLSLLQAAEPGDLMRITLVRQGHEMSVDVTLGSW